MNYAYILKCGDGSYYTGWTNDLMKRLKAHQSGKGAKYTRTHLPVELVYFENFETKQEAQSREWHLKRLSHGQKQELAASMNIAEAIAASEQERNKEKEMKTPCTEKTLDFSDTKKPETL